MLPQPVRRLLLLLTVLPLTLALEHERAREHLVVHRGLVEAVVRVQWRCERVTPVLLDLALHQDLEAVKEGQHPEPKFDYGATDWDGDGEDEDASAKYLLDSSKYTIRTESSHDGFKDEL